MKFQTAYPTLGEFIRAIAGVLDSKPNETNDSSDPAYRMAKNLDRLADEGDFDYTMIEPLLEHVFKAPFEPHPAFEEYLKWFGNITYKRYIELIKNVSLAGFGRDQSLPWLIDYYATHSIFEFVVQRQELYLSELDGYNIFISDKPVTSTLNWMEQKYPNFKEFKKTFGFPKTKSIQIKIAKDTYRDWISGKVTPRSLSLWGEDGLLTKFFSNYSIDYGDQNIINEAFYFSKALQNFYKISENYNSREILISICKQEFRPQPDFEYLKKFLHIPEEKIIEKMELFFKCYLDLQDSLVNRVNTITDSQEMLAIIEKAEFEIEKKKEFNPSWWEISRFRGMWNVFNRQYEAAIPHYVDAVDGALYSGTENARKILREAVALCCQAYEEGLRKVDSKNLKSIIKRLKSQGSALGFYHPWKLEAKGVPEKEIQLTASYFWQYFPGSKMF